MAKRKMVFEKICKLLGRKIPVLFVTGVPEQVDVDFFASKVAVLKKPANMDSLLYRAENLLE